MNPAETTGVVRLMSANSSTAEMAWVESEEDFTEEQPRDRVASSADKNDYCTIYLLRNTVSGKIYVGQTWLALNMRAGKRGEKYSNSIYLYASIQKHGWDRFEYEILTHCRTQARADWLESYHMRKLDAQNPAVGYNLDDGGSCGKRSDETRAKISKSMKEKVWSPEATEGRRASGRARRGETRPPCSEEYRADKSKQIADRHATYGHPMQGKTHSNRVRGLLRKENRRSLDPLIVAGYLGGMAIPDLATKYEVSDTTIRNVLDRTNTKKRARNLGETLDTRDQAKINQTTSERVMDESERQIHALGIESVHKAGV